MWFTPEASRELESSGTQGLWLMTLRFRLQRFGRLERVVDIKTRAGQALILCPSESAVSADMEGPMLTHSRGQLEMSHETEDTHPFVQSGLFLV